MLETEQQFYRIHREELRRKYLGKRVVIEKDTVLGVFGSDREALDAMQSHKPGTFMIKYIPVDPEDEVAVFSSPFMPGHCGATARFGSF
jgi:hypothetical protein